VVRGIGIDKLKEAGVNAQEVQHWHPKNQIQKGHFQEYCAFVAGALSHLDCEYCILHTPASIEVPGAASSSTELVPVQGQPPTSNPMTTQLAQQLGLT